MTKYVSHSDKELLEYFSTTLSKLIKEKGLYQKDIADKMGIGDTTISMYVNGYMFPTYCTLYNLALALECPVETFFPPNMHSRKKHSLL